MSTILECLAAMKPRPAQRKPRPAQYDRRLARRHTAAMQMVEGGWADGELLLCYVIWPTPAIERALDAVLASPR